MSADIRKAAEFGANVCPVSNQLPAPYYQHDGITIYHGDCREILPKLGAVDLLLTDPPYGINCNTDNRRFSGGHPDSRNKRGDGIGSGNGMPVRGDDKPHDPRFMLDAARHKIIWGWNHFADKLPAGSCLVWIKKYDEAFGTFLSDAEVAWKSTGHGVYCRRDLSNNAIANSRVHPTQKPIGLMCWCLSMFKDAATVIDPFMGSGSTLLACKIEGRKAIGIEIEEKYCEIAIKRLAQKVLF